MKHAVRLLVLAMGCSASTPQLDDQLSAAAAPAAATTAAEPVAFVATYERIWSALPRAYKAVGITVNAADTSTRSMGFAGVIRRELGGVRLSKYFLCGNQMGDNADTYDITLFMASQVGKDPQGRIVVTTGLRVSAKSAFGGTSTRCTSSGELERRLVAALRAEVP